MDYPPTQHAAHDATFAATGTASGQSGLHSDLSVRASILPEAQAALYAAFKEWKCCVTQASAQHAQPTSIDFAKLQQVRQQFHQADSVLQKIGLQGIALYHQALEALWSALEKGLPLTPLLQQTVATALQALAEYLGDLMAGQAEAPLKLYLPYQQVQQTLQAERIHPADLWFHPLPTLTLPPLECEFVPKQGSASTGFAALEAIRTRYEAAMLAWLRSGQTSLSRTAHEPEAALTTLAQCMQEVAQTGQLSARTPLGVRNYWYLAQQFFEIVRCGGVRADAQPQRLAARMNLLLKHYAQQELEVPERLLRDTVFALAFADDAKVFDADVALALANIRKAFALPEHSLFAEMPYLRPHYALVPHEQLVAARQHLQSIRAGWEALTAADVNSVPDLPGTFDALQAALTAFGQPELQRLVQEMRAQTLRLSKAQQTPQAALSTEIASALSFIEQGLQQPWRSAGESVTAQLFGERCGGFIARMQTAAAEQALAQSAASDAATSAVTPASPPITVAPGVTTLAGAASLLQGDMGAHVPDTTTPVADTNVIAFPFATPLAKEDDNYKQVGPLRISLALYNVYLQEADTLVTRLATDFAEWRHEARLAPTALALRSAHALQGSSATVGLEPVRLVAAELAQTLGLLQKNQAPLSAQELDVLCDTVEYCRAMLHQFAAGIWPKDEATLQEVLAACCRLGQRPITVTPKPSIDSDA